MLRKLLCALVLILAVGPLPVQAQEDSLPSDILVNQRLGDSPVAGGSVELCRVGEIRGEGYVLGEEFGGGFASMEDVLSPEFAFWMSRRAGTGLIQPVNPLGTVRFPETEPGLYLVRQRQAPEGYVAFRPYLVSVTGEMTLVDTYPVMEPREENPTTSEPARPYLGALGLSLAVTGFLFWDEARKRDAAEHGPE